MASNLRLILFCLFAALFLQAVVSTTPASLHPLQLQHPLDPLTKSEISVIQKLVQSKYPTSHHKLTFHYVGLNDPDKATVLKWASSKPNSVKIPHESLVIVRVDGRTHEIVIDLKTKKIISDEIHNGNGFPIVTVDEQSQAILLPFNHTGFIESIKKRGINLSEVVCSTFTIGWYGEKKSTRTLRVECFSQEGTANIYVRPINGIFILVDIEKMQIVGYHDRSIEPLPKKENTEYRASHQKPPFGPKLHSMASFQPQGPGFKLNGNTVRLSDWTVIRPST